MIKTPETARIFKCLSEGTRLRVVRLLAEEELAVTELQAILELPQSTLSRHLSVLKEGGLVDLRREGARTLYRLRAPEGLNGHGEALLGLLGELLSEDEEALRDRAGLERVLEERRQRSREHFDHSGHTWDELVEQVADPRLRDRALLRLVPSRRTVVDVGTGGGALLAELAATGARVIGVDHAPGQIARARRHAQTLGLRNVEVREGDFGALPLEAGEADAVLFHLSLHHAPNPEAALREARRVLAPGGTVVVTDFLPHDRTWLQEEHADLWLGFEPERVDAWLAELGFEERRLEQRAFVRPEREETRSDPTSGLRVFVVSGRVPQSEQKERSS